MYRSRSAVVRVPGLGKIVVGAALPRVYRALKRPIRRDMKIWYRRQRVRTSAST